MSKGQQAETKPDEEQKEDPLREPKSDPCGKIPGYCSASCVTRECVRNKIKEYPKTSDVYATCNLPKRFEHPHWFNGYGSQTNRQHPIYRTTSNEYGWFAPGIHSIASSYYPLPQKFSAHLHATGMYRNYSLNMSAPDPPTKMC